MQVCSFKYQLLKLWEASFSSRLSIYEYDEFLISTLAHDYNQRDIKGHVENYLKHAAQL